MSAQEFVRMAASLTPDGEEDDTRLPFDMSSDDAVKTLGILISAARSILEDLTNE